LLNVSGRLATFACLISFPLCAVQAQLHEHEMHMPDKSKSQKSAKTKQAAPAQHDMHEHEMQMQHEMHMQHDMHGMGMMAPFAGIPHSRGASGTSWQPDSTPMHAQHQMLGLWQIMQHYNAFVSYDNQSGPRGDDQFNSANWYMLMASRKLGNGELMLRGMFSL